MKHKHIIPHKAVADRLAAQGIEITKEAVGLYRNGVNGSKYAAHIDAVVAELTAEYAKQIRLLALRQNRAIQETLNSTQS